MTEGPVRRSWLPLGVAAGLLAAVLGVILFTGGGEDEPRCATEADAASPLLPPGRFTEDPRLAELGTAVDAMAAPFGEVVAGVGYDYDQWLRLYATSEGLLTFTKNNAPTTMLDARTLEPRWALKPESKRIAWDASADRFVVLNLSAKSQVRIGSYDLGSGAERWCTRLSTTHEDGQPVSTAFVDGGDLLVALPVDSGIDVARMAGEDGHVRWWQPLRGVDRADFLAQVSADLFVAGGAEAFRLAEDPPGGKERSVLTAFAAKDGAERWTYELPGDARLHVAGLAEDLLVLLVRDSAGSRLVGLDLDGEEQWRSALPEGSLDVTVRGDVVMARSRSGLTAYATTTGVRRWALPVPQEKTYFPYGFTLDQMPSLDETHVLMPTTTALEVLDLGTGRSEAYPLPTDGISTTYWPYQVAVTPESIAVVTNTGGVVARRE